MSEQLDAALSRGSNATTHGSCLKFQLLAGPLSQCAKNTTVEGLPNAISAGSLWRKIAWSVLLLCVLTCCTVHLVMLIRDFNNSSVSSTLNLDAKLVEFPDVTICGLKPISESFLLAGLKHNWVDIILNYMRTIDSWFKDVPRLQTHNETLAEYTERMKILFFKMFEVARLHQPLFHSWLNINYETSILHCKFNNIPCQANNFTLIQHNQHFNCLTFSPDEHNKMANSGSNFNSGLHVNIFTDSSIFESAFLKYTEYRQSTRTYYNESMTLKEYLSSNPDEFPINSILAKKGDPNGILAIVHPRNTYPFDNGHPSYILRSGSSGSLRMSTIEKRKVVSGGREPCSSQPAGNAVYNTEFAVANGTTRARKFVRVPEDALHEWAQQELHRRCGCYSHRIPTGAAASSLCYYVEAFYSTLDLFFSEENARRIDCHDRWLPEVQEAAVSSVQLKKPCDSLYREIRLETIEWPSDEDTVPIAASFINLRQRSNLSNSNDFLANSSADIKAKFLRENAAINAISTCPNIKDLFETSLHKVANCLKLEVIKQNVVRLLVRLDSAYTESYTESNNYEWEEILSEVGGVIGLWLGMSLLTVFELFDLFWIIATWDRQARASQAEESQGVKQMEFILDDKELQGYFTSGCSMVID